MFKFVWRGMDLSHKYDEVPVASADKEFNKHFHNFYEIFYFISGTAMYTVENEKRLLQPYDGLIIRPGEFHNVEFLDQTPYERYVFKLPVGFVMPYVADKLNSRSAFFPNQRDALELFQKIDKAYEIYTGNDMYYYSGCVAVEAMINFCGNREKSADDYNLANSKVVPILQYINDNIELPLTLTQIAEQFHYSPDYLSREFYRYMKTPIMKYVRTKRVLAANRLLLSGFKPTQIPELLGYSDYSTFYRSYVSIMGKPPSEDFNEKGSTFFPDN